MLCGKIMLVHYPLLWHQLHFEEAVWQSLCFLWCNIDAKQSFHSVGIQLFTSINTTKNNVPFLPCCLLLSYFWVTRFPLRSPSYQECMPAVYLYQNPAVESQFDIYKRTHTGKKKLTSSETECTSILCCLERVGCEAWSKCSSKWCEYPRIQLWSRTDKLSS